MVSPIFLGMNINHDLDLCAKTNRPSSTAHTIAINPRASPITRAALAAPSSRKLTITSRTTVSIATRIPETVFSGHEESRK
jgi:hypothetical protein